MADIESPEDVTAQNVVDALRFAFMAQMDRDERLKLVEAMFEFAPDTLDDGGINFIHYLLGQGTLKLEVVG